MILNLLLINIIITYVWDILNFPNKIAGLLTALLTNNRITNVELKPPIGCSFCMIFWIALIYLLCNGIALLVAIGVALLIAYLNKITLYTITLLDSIVDRIFRFLEDAINK